MANQIILQQQKFKFSDITATFPGTGNPKRKVFFQSELRSLANGDATFGVIAYAAWKNGAKWVIGKKIDGADFGTPITLPFKPPLAFANNEVILSAKISKKKKDPRKGRWNSIIKAINKNCNKKTSKAEITFLFKGGISENPHLEYEVTLDFGGGTVLDAVTKPSPPAPPEA